MNWLRKLLPAARPSCRQPRSKRLVLEQLEARQLLNGSSLFSPFPMSPVNGLIYGTADDGVHGRELYRNDLAHNGAKLVMDINPGAAGSDIKYLTTLNGFLYFAANDGTTGQELWKLDLANARGPATAVLPTEVKDINRGPAGSNIQFLTTIHGRMYFTADDGVHGQELWRTDGAAADTTLVADVNPGPGDSAIHFLTNLGGAVYFTADDGVHGQELWRSAVATEQTNLVKDINPGSAGSNIHFLTTMAGVLYFTAADGVHGQELWRSDGTAAGTALVADIDPGRAGAQIHFVMTTADNHLVFTAYNPASGVELWASDGTTTGTGLIQDIDPGPAGSQIRLLTRVGADVYFTANDGTDGYQLWKTDGTDDGTVPLMGISQNTVPNAHFLATLDGKILFTADDGTADGAAGAKLFSYTISQHRGLVIDVNQGAGQAHVKYQTKLNAHTVLFTSTDGRGGVDLWGTNGITAWVVTDFNTGVGPVHVRYLATLRNGTAFFEVIDNLGTHLWTIDKDADAVGRLNYIVSPSGAAIHAVWVGQGGTVLGFDVNDQVHGDEPWRSDGTAAGTYLVTDINHALTAVDAVFAAGTLDLGN